MKTRPYSVLLLTIFLVSACGPASTNKFQFHHKTNAFTHGHSGFHFPEQIGKFVRGRINQYDPEGKDISVRYNIEQPPSAVIATIYIHPAPISPASGTKQMQGHPPQIRVFDQYVESVKQDTLLAHPDAQILAQSPKSMRVNQATITGIFMKFQLKTLAGQAIETFLELYIFQFGPWMIKYSITYPPENQDLATEQIAPLIDQFQIKP